MYKILNFYLPFVFCFMISVNGTGNFVLAKDTKTKIRIFENQGGDFKLTGPDNEVISSFNFRGKVLLIYFGYTYCPDVCPMTLTLLKQMMKDLKDQSKNVQVFFISIDPERDPPEKLKDYVPYFHPTFVGLTGTVKDVSKVAKQFGSHFFKQKVDSEEGYFMAHMEGVFLVDKKGRYRGRYKTNQDIDKLLEDIQWLIESDS